MALYNRLLANIANERITHIRKRGVTVKTALRLHLYNRVFNKFKLVFAESQRSHKLFIVALNSFYGGITRRNADFLCVVLYLMRHRVNTAVNRSRAAKIKLFGHYFLFCRFNHSCNKLAYTVAFCRRYRNNRHAHKLRKLFNIDAAAV